MKLRFPAFITAILSLLIAQMSLAQSSLIQSGSMYEYMVKRYEIKSGILANKIHTNIAPFYRDEIGYYLDSQFAQIENPVMADRFYMQYHQADNPNWSAGKWNDANKPFLKYFYKNRNSIYSVHEDGLELFVNPVINYTLGGQTDYTLEDNIFKNERGVEVRGNFDRKIGFYTYFTDNQARYPTYVRQWQGEFGALPGEGFVKGFKEGGVDHYTVRAHVTWSALQNVKFTFGHGRNFLGNGMRSMLLSDFARDYLHLRVNSNFWRFNYQNLFMELSDYQNRIRGQFNYPRKYIAAHYLSLDVTKKLNVGLYEAIVFNQTDSISRQGFELNYLNPIIFYRGVEHYLGSEDNVLMALTANYLPFKGVSLYGQFIIDEMKFFKWINEHDWGGNQYGVQAGLRYIDVLGVTGLDYNVEFNASRPYMYAHRLPGNNYVHFNQPLAHPYGANFKELINKVTFVPANNLVVEAMYNYSIIGLDTGDVNYGRNPLNSTEGWLQTYGNSMAQGVPGVLNRIDLNLSYMLFHNFWLELRLTKRSFITNNANFDDRDDYFFHAGVRWNAIAKNLYF